MSEGKTHREETASAKALWQDCASEQIKGSTAGEPGGKEKDADKTTF